MAIAFDGDNKLIVLSGPTRFLMSDIYRAARDWSYLPSSMQYLSPLSASGKASLGGGLYTDVIYVLTFGWKLLAQGYAYDADIEVVGSLVTDDGSKRTAPVAPGVNEVSWVFQVATSGIIVDNPASGGGSANGKLVGTMGVVIPLRGALRPTYGLHGRLNPDPEPLEGHLQTAVELQGTISDTGPLVGHLD